MVLQTSISILPRLATGGALLLLGLVLLLVLLPLSFRYRRWWWTSMTWPTLMSPLLRIPWR